MSAATLLKLCQSNSSGVMLRRVAQSTLRLTSSHLRPCMASFATHAAGRKQGDGLDLWLNDHDELTDMFQKYRDTKDRRGKKDLAGDIIRSVTIHQSAEDRTIYPAVGRHVPQQEGGPMLQSHDHLVDIVGRYMMDWLEKHDPSNDVEWGLWDKTVLQVISMTEEHIKDEEEHQATSLRKHLTREDLDKLGRDFVEAKKSSPTHPHPEGPTTPWASKVMHPLTGAMDRAADAAKETLQGDRDST